MAFNPHRRKTGRQGSWPGFDTDGLRLDEICGRGRGRDRLPADESASQDDKGDDEGDGNGVTANQ